MPCDSSIGSFKKGFRLASHYWLSWKCRLFLGGSTFPGPWDDLCEHASKHRQAESCPSGVRGKLFVKRANAQRVLSLALDGATRAGFTMEDGAEHLIRLPMRAGPIRGVGQLMFIGHRQNRVLAFFGLSSSSLQGSRRVEECISKSGVERSRAPVESEARGRPTTPRRSLRSVCQLHLPREGVSHCRLASCNATARFGKWSTRVMSKSPLPSCLPLPASPPREGQGWHAVALPRAISQQTVHYHSKSHNVTGPTCDLGSPNHSSRPLSLYPG
jgi:hypothetical protein